MSATLSRNESWSIARLAFFYLDRGRFKEAEALARGLITLDQRDGLGWLYYGEARQMQGDLNEALRGYQEAAKYLPQDGLVWIRFGQVLLRLGRGAEAGKALGRALGCDLSPGETARVNALLKRCR